MASSNHPTRRAAARVLTLLVAAAVLLGPAPAPAEAATPLVITDLAVGAIGSTTATVTWTTNRGANSQVRYGPTTAYGSATPIDPVRVLRHKMVLTGLAPGTYYHFRARSVDSNGRSATSVDWTFETAGSDVPAPDTTAPSVSVTAPASGAVVSGAVTLAAAASDAVGVVGVRFRVDGNALGAEDVTTPYAVPLDSTSLADGSHTVTATARDAAGNSATSAAIVFTVSNRAPSGGQFYVAPTGLPTNSGTAASPWDLQTALGHPPSIRPGDTIVLRGGVYRGSFESRLTGTSSGPITVRGAAGERAVIDGATSSANTLRVLGPWTVFRDFEVTNSNPVRQSSSERPIAVWVEAAHTKLVNLIVHDGGNGIGLWQAAEDSEVYGCVVFNNGWEDAGGGKGHGIYTQNRYGTKRIADNIVLNNFNFGIQVYGREGWGVGYLFEGNASFNNGSPVSRGGDTRTPGLFVGTTDNPSDRIAVRNNFFYSPAHTLGGALRLGYTAAGNGSIEVRDNYIANGAQTFEINDWASATVTGNTVYTTSTRAGSGANSFLAFLRTPNGVAAPYLWNDNRFFETLTPEENGTTYGFAYNGREGANGGWLSFGEWKTFSGFDSASAYARRKPLDQVFVRRNEYQPNRANILVFNWSGAASIAVDVTGAIAPGTAFEVRNAQDYNGAPVLSGTYTGQLLVIPMTGLSVARPTGHDYTPASTAPEFGAFVLVPR